MEGRPELVPVPSSKSSSEGWEEDDIVHRAEGKPRRARIREGVAARAGAEHSTRIYILLSPLYIITKSPAAAPPPLGPLQLHIHLLAEHHFPHPPLMHPPITRQLGMEARHHHIPLPQHHNVCIGSQLAPSCGEGCGTRRW